MSELPKEIPCHDHVIGLLEQRIDQLYRDGKAIVDRYWKVIYAMENKLPGWESKCRLQIRCIVKGNSIRADWTEVKWYGSSSKGDRNSIRRQIIKPKDSYGYTLSKLKTLAPEWAKEIVEETEMQLVGVRREASHLVKAIMYIKHARTAFSEDVSVEAGDVP
ncbi:MAG TPA: conjugative transfer protein MobI(A/C) [Nitrospira sp.]|nr:conjugative transfer protein MobI(A/C) [Nitrospira sp.]